MILQDQNPLLIIIDWLSDYSTQIMLSIITLVVGIVIAKIVKHELSKLAEGERLEKTLSKNIGRFTEYVIILIVGTVIIMQFAETVGILAAMLSVVGGTVIGFAAMNTIGNAIAGIIIMISKPFSVGDRILTPDGKIADVVDIKLVYTVLVDLDNIRISVPNQTLLAKQIENFGTSRVIRRSVTITPGFDEDREKVERVLLDAAKKVPEVLDEPVSYVWINRFQDYAVEYILFVFIDDIGNMPRIDSDLHKAVLDECKENDIDIRTPLLLRQLG